MALGPVFGPVFGPALRGFTNQALRSDMMYEIREDFKQEIWDVEDMMVSRIDEMLLMMRRLMEIIEKVSLTADNLQLLLSTILSSGILTNEQLGQMLNAVAVAQQAQQNAPAPEPPPPPVATSSGGFHRGRRW